MIDVVAPCIALGLCLGRIGCLLNGCCYGNLACPNCPAITFPLSSAARAPMVDRGVQTTAGFTLERDHQRIVDWVEPGSGADLAGLKKGDEIVGVNDVDLRLEDLLQEAAARRQAGRHEGREDHVAGRAPARRPDHRNRAVRDRRSRAPDHDGLHHRPEPCPYRRLGRLGFRGREGRAPAGRQDRRRQRPKRRSCWNGSAFPFHEAFRNNWPRGKNDLSLIVVRDGREIDIGPFTHRTVPLHPTQIYESISMILLVFLLLSIYPYNRVDGLMMVIFMVGYAVHRFLNESLRNDTDPGRLRDDAVAEHQHLVADRSGHSGLLRLATPHLEDDRRMTKHESTKPPVTKARREPFVIGETRHSWHRRDA